MEMKHVLMPDDASALKKTVAQGLAHATPAAAPQHPGLPASGQVTTWQVVAMAGGVYPLPALPATEMD
jgi:hypothetical protein